MEPQSLQPNIPNTNPPPVVPPPTPPMPDAPTTPTADASQTSSILKPLQTYERDIADMIRSHQASTVQVKLAAEKKKEALPIKEKVKITREESSGRGRGILVGLSVLLIVVGIGALSYLFIQKQFAPEDVVPVTVKPNTLLAADGEINFTIDALTQRQIADGYRALLMQSYTNFKLFSIAVTQTVAGSKQKVSPKTFFEYSTLSIPARLLRAMGETMFSGIYIRNDVHPFFIVKIEDFDIAYESMLVWEKTMFQDFESFIRTQKGMEPTAAALPQAVFVDAVVGNKDTRILKDVDSNTIMMYSFIDSKTLIIADTEDTFKEILTRYQSSQSIR